MTIDTVSSPIRKYIRHPSGVPIQVALDCVDDEYDESNDETLSNVGLGGLSFVSKHVLKIKQKVRVCIPVLETENMLIGSVVWCEKSNNGYEIGLEFDSTQVYRLRMIEQICHIEHYRKEIERKEGPINCGRSGQGVDFALCRRFSSIVNSNITN